MTENIFAQPLLPKPLTSDSKLSAFYITPNLKPPIPLIVYMHGLIVEQKGYQESASLGYDVRDFANAISKNGFAAYLPLRSPEDNDISSINSEIEKFLLSHSEIDSSSVALVGFSKGGAIAISMAMARPDVYKKLVLISPAISEAKCTSINEKFTGPILITIGTEDPSSIISGVSKCFKDKSSWKSGIAPIIKTFDGNHRSFWKVRPDHWKEVIAFISNPSH
ncbi:MAG: dienelactone hydrolase family protein [Bdellovibrionales bacterium]|nr:dienelactone hydrolase family protein [Bdellovibrionales bacterium]